MALNFGETKGSAKKNSFTTYTYNEGENEVRLFGGILARYVYWVTNPSDGKRIPMECLAYNRDTEAFDNKEVDWVEKLLKDDNGERMKPSWAYVMYGIDVKDGQAKVVNLKRKLFDSIKFEAKEGLGDPTDVDTGWDIKFTKEKTGPLPFNVEYKLRVRALENRPLTDAEKTVVEATESIDGVLKRPTAENQKEFIETKILGMAASEDVPADVAAELI